MMIKYCIWDVGNTIYPYSLDPLYQWGLAHTKDKSAYVQKHGAKSYDYKPYMAGEIDNQQFAKELCAHCNIDYSNRSLIEINKELHRGVGKTFEQTLDAMHFLAQNGIQNGLLSNAIPLLGDTSITQVDKRYSFPSYDIGYLKPDKKAFEMVRKLIGCEYSEMIFVDDKAQNVKAAAELGIHAVQYNKDDIVADIKKIAEAERKMYLGQEIKHTILPLKEGKDNQ